MPKLQYYNTKKTFNVQYKSMKYAKFTVLQHEICPI